jgi:hypothetical protein
MKILFFSVPLLLLLSSIVIVAAFAQEEEQETIQQKQILINPNNIANITSYGQYKDPTYTKYYQPENLFDNSLSQNSWWSQYGKSGFAVNLKQPLQTPVCNADIEVAQIPQNSSFSLSIGSNKTFNGLLDSNVVKPDFGEECIENVQSIKMDINESVNTKSNKISELRLFTYVNITPPPPEPHICPVNEEWNETQQKCVPIQKEENVTKITVNNSKAILDISNSEIEINIDSTSQITLPNLNVPIQKVEVPSVVVQPPEEPPEQEEEDESDKDDDDKKDDKKEDN